ncbi:MAG: MotA/TolQ/ExbB proton channel family protein [Verrucomicrobiales bacterium]|nr:MotA/TolQ/ExbB proton channel family protein [Verrucomicrobiales bacterium]
MRLHLLTLITFLCLAANGEDRDASANYRKAAASAELDLKSALGELADLRKTIASEKPSIAKSANEIAAELREARRRADLARSRKDAVEAEFAKTDDELKQWRNEKIYLEGLLADFQKNLGSPGAPLELLESSIKQLESAGSVTVNPGSALGGDGVLIEGELVNAGPVSWFLSTDRKTSGIVSDSMAPEPRIVEGTDDKSAILNLIEGNAASPAFDPTLGNALALTETESSLLDHIKEGGFWIIPILLLAFIALLAALAKWIQLLKIRAFPSAKIQEIIRDLNAENFDKAATTAKSIQHPSGAILETGVNLVETSSDPTRDDLEESLFEKFLEAQPALQRGLPLIAIASATAPLLGLLGTVTGMIETFRLINIFGTGDAKTLASGISEALVTTEFGLIVAIPALILHALLSRKITGIKSTMEMTSLAFLNGIKLKGDQA